MPSSYIDSMPPIVHALVDLQPLRVIDVGPGWGKYGLACREYLPSLEQLWAIEVPEGRLPTQDVIYDGVWEQDVRELAEAGWPWKEADVVLLVDVIEHMTLIQGHRLLHAIADSGTRAIVATPKEFFEQDDEENPYEVHVSLWSWNQLRAHPIERDLSTIDAIIYQLGARS